MTTRTTCLIATASATVLIAVVTGCGASQQTSSTAEQPGPASPHSAAVGHDDASRHASSAKPIVVTGSQARIRAYGLPSLDDFVADPFVVGVVQGKVTASRTVVSDDQSTVHTVLTVRVSHGGGLKGGQIIEVSELGGIVHLREVRSQFEGKEWQEPLTEAQLDQLVDFQMEDTPHTSVGDELVFLLAGKDENNGVYALAAKLAPGGKEFGWVGHAPNPAWQANVSNTDVQRYLSAKKGLKAHT